MVNVDRPRTPVARRDDGEQSRAPTPTSRPIYRRQRQPRGGKRARGSRTETVNQGEIPEPSAPQPTEQQQPSQAGPSQAPSQNTQFTEISQTLMEMQNRQFELQAKQGEQLKDAIREMNEGRLRERELELKAQKESEERRIQAEAERDIRNQEFQLKMVQLMASLMPGPSQQNRPGPSDDQDQPPPGLS